MEASNVVPIRPDLQHSARMMMGHHLERLVARFKQGGRRQPDVFTRLSVFVEELEIEVKRTFGQRSGKLSAAYGPDLAPMKSRFSARQGVPPKPLYSTPDAWLRVLQGFAREMGRNEYSLLANALERAFDVSGSGAAGAPGDYSEVFLLLDALKDHVLGAGDLVRINEYVSRSGLYLRDGTVQVSEWPWTEAGLIDGMIYDESAFDFVPKVFGVNAVEVASVDLLLPDLDGEDFEFLADFKSSLPASGKLELHEARLIGLSVAINEANLQPELALLEWDRAAVTIVAANGDILGSSSVQSPVGKPALVSESATGLSDGYASPPDWHPAGIRIHFRGSDGFNRLLRSTLVRPWIWTDLNPMVWAPSPSDDQDDYPVSAPAHTAAAFIEGNLLYADIAERSGDRIDRLLIQSVQDIESTLQKFREQGEAIRLPRRNAVLAEWASQSEQQATQTEGA